MRPAERKQIERFYEQARQPSDLPWHLASVPPLLVVAAAGHPCGRALDVGCGTGEHAIYLASQGWQVTAIDLVPKALHMAYEQARRAGVEVEFVEADVRHWRPDEAFDLALDFGCLHGMRNRGEHARHRRLLSQWVVRGGSLCLLHFVRRQRGLLRDWRPIGPIRLRREEVIAMFSLDFDLQADPQYILHTSPFPVGRVEYGVFWFRRR